jgi:hypothetical protein
MKKWTTIHIIQVKWILFSMKTNCTQNQVEVEEKTETDKLFYSPQYPMKKK